MSQTEGTAGQHEERAHQAQGQWQPEGREPRQMALGRCRGYSIHPVGLCRQRLGFCLKCPGGGYKWGMTPSCAWTYRRSTPPPPAAPTLPPQHWGACEVTDVGFQVRDTQVSFQSSCNARCLAVGKPIPLCASIFLSFMSCGLVGDI